MVMPGLHGLMPLGWMTGTPVDGGAMRVDDGTALGRRPCSWRRRQSPAGSSGRARPQPRGPPTGPRARRSSADVGAEPSGTSEMRRTVRPDVRTRHEGELLVRPRSPVRRQDPEVEHPRRRAPRYRSHSRQRRRQPARRDPKPRTTPALGPSPQGTTAAPRRRPTKVGECQQETSARVSGCATGVCSRPHSTALWRPGP